MIIKNNSVFLIISNIIYHYDLKSTDVSTKLCYNIKLVHHFKLYFFFTQAYYLLVYKTALLPNILQLYPFRPLYNITIFYGLCVQTIENTSTLVFMVQTKVELIVLFLFSFLLLLFYVYYNYELYLSISNLIEFKQTISYSFNHGDPEVFNLLTYTINIYTYIFHLTSWHFNVNYFFWSCIIGHLHKIILIFPFPSFANFFGTFMI
ncbi:hypothetical protein AGLY_010141 [Aphis glycines]|uniref:Uncharacterized protein n=1 Tax=Aphis glycines TaxID=307491 RepID=A0A6G0TF64_APHGL|nr:hypothetical protein AGLY_010141 [Aphis glycines]